MILFLSSSRSRLLHHRHFDHAQSHLHGHVSTSGASTRQCPADTLKMRFARVRSTRMSFFVDDSPEGFISQLLRIPRRVAQSEDIDEQDSIPPRGTTPPRVKEPRRQSRCAAKVP